MGAVFVSDIMARSCYLCEWDDSDLCFDLNKRVEFDCYKARSLNNSHPEGISLHPGTVIILTQSQTFFVHAQHAQHDQELIIGYLAFKFNWQINSCEIHSEVKITKINEDVVKQIALRCTRSCVLWMFGFAEIKREIIENDRTFSITTDHTFNITE
jgi:hypothetical protein